MVKSIKAIGTKRLVRLFDLNMKVVVSHESRSRWINVIVTLSQESEKDIEREFVKVLESVGPDKPKLYYLEAVRRNLMISKNESYKREPMPKAIKDLFR